MFQTRILKEIRSIGDNHNEGFLLKVNENDSKKWKAFLFGPPETPYEAGIFEVQITVGQDYPISPPKCVFSTMIFHPNVHDKTGEICVDILKSQWTPMWTLNSLCKAILSLMQDPNADSPLNCDAGNMIRNNDKEAFFDTAALYTATHAISKMEFEKYLKTL